jgi:anti-anti-sigma factor
MSESSYLAVGDHVSLLLGTVRCEKVGAREAQILEKEIDGLAPARGWRIVLDMTEVTMVASMGLGLLVSVHKKAKGSGGSLVICSLRPELLQLLQLTHLHKVLKIVPDKNAALKILV